MVTKVVMPRLSLTMKEGTVGKWYKKEGDTVDKNEPIAELLSEKATYDLEAPASGILRKIYVAEGIDVPVNQILAVIADADEPISEKEVRGEEVLGVSEVEAKVMLASPAAKRLAREHGIDLAQVKGSGVEGRISEEDVQQIISRGEGHLPRVRERIRLSGVRKASAEKVSNSFRTAAHSAVLMEVDVSQARIIHQKSGISYNAMLVWAAAKSLMEHPAINSCLEGDYISVFASANVGVAVASENGLVVPVIHDAEKKSLQQIEMEIAEVTDRARQGKLSGTDVAGGTFTVTNLGMFGVDFFTPIINPPEAAILGVGRIVEKPVVVEGKVQIKPVLVLCLSYDHRIVDGAPAAQFLAKIKEILERISQPET